MRKLFSLVVFCFSAVIFAEGLPVQDGDFGCITAQKAQQYVRDFNINVSSFGGMELCNANVDTKKLFNDLQLIEKGQFSGSEKNIFIGNFVDSNNYYGWAQRQTAGVRRGQDIPTATAYNSSGYFTMQDGWARLSSLGRVGVFLHEARHTEGYYHVQCDQGPYKNVAMAGCDETLREGGSHGVEMEYYSRVVLQGENFHPVYKQMARLMNLGRANFVFNETVMKSQEILVASGDKEILLMDEDAKIIHTPLAYNNGGSLHRSSFGVTLLNETSATAVDLYSGNLEPINDEYSYFKLLGDGRMPKVSDMEEFDVNNKRYLFALTQDGKLYSFVFSQGRWSSPSSVPNVVALVTTSPQGQEGLFALTKTNEVYVIDPQNMRLGNRVGTWDPLVVNYVKWGSQLLSVHQSGEVLESASGKSYLPLASYKVQQMVRAPIYDAFGYDNHGNNAFGLVEVQYQ